eukprot:32560-Eustigmatos_ZCMA.PRE.1
MVSSIRSIDTDREAAAGAAEARQKSVPSYGKHGAMRFCDAVNAMVSREAWPPMCVRPHA